jgi:hypothetical protein
MKFARTLLVALPLLIAPVAQAQLLFNTGDGNSTSYREPSFGPGQGVLVSTPTTLTNLGFYLGLPSAGNIKFLIFDGTNSSLLFSTALALGPQSNGTLTVSDPFSFALNAGSIYNFGVIADGSLNIDYFFPPITDAANGLAIVGVNSNYSNYDSPGLSDIGGQATIALALYGTQGSVTTTPEPASIILLGTGLVGVFGAAGRKRNHSFAS